MLHDEQDDQNVGDFREREERGVEQANQKQSGGAECNRELLHPPQEARHSPECRLGAPCPDIPASRSSSLWERRLFGTVAAVHYSQLGLTLAHYDARAHLVVARRILDSLTPGWQQIGAVWLPLPHVLNMLPVQVDGLYRNGASAIAISILSMALAAGALTSLLLRTHRLADRRASPVRRC